MIITDAISVLLWGMLLIIAIVTWREARRLEKNEPWNKPKTKNVTDSVRWHNLYNSPYRHCRGASKRG